MKRFAWEGETMCTPEETAHIVFGNMQLTGTWFCSLDTYGLRARLLFVQVDAGDYVGILTCRHVQDYQAHPPTLQRRAINVPS